MIPFNVLTPSTFSIPISPSFPSGANRLTPFTSPPAASKDRVVILKALLQPIPVPVLKKPVRCVLAEQIFLLTIDLGANLSIEEK
ncbi:hypothetical protein OCU04_011326 [Sclerotinia nivalis]|uniref:Uncharacterized protein n=1 Tax=Sclerotinia nivalis TaxID=352851 RepID=A0A9X0ACI6_9HELO|nr:hypothetical protein OCU04_011326 [Sclerotinia nivalis]